MKAQRRPEQNRISKKEFFDIFGLTPSGASQQTGIPLAELGKIIGQIARRMHIPPRSVLNQVRYFRISESFLMNIAVKYNRPNRRATQQDNKEQRNKMG
ncbi:MAG: hypothetical protein WGN25_11505 [Candidatus Electrothrix sp. GW3-4]|uniref:hypothetical protein n=1 Tax=Candidatus Electrothrix sp. GW3-4 TaxID=3126740 RepID=UPI0030D125B5